MNLNLIQDRFFIYDAVFSRENIKNLDRYFDLSGPISKVFGKYVNQKTSFVEETEWGDLYSKTFNNYRIDFFVVGDYVENVFLFQDNHIVKEFECMFFNEKLSEIKREYYKL